MKIALIGYGKMGRIIESLILEEKKHEIILKISEKNIDDFTIENLQKADVAIEFTEPKAAMGNVLNCFEAGIPVVVGTTSWNSDTVIKMAKEDGHSLFISPNFSIGVNLFRILNKKLNQLMTPFNDYQIEMTEIHHTEKKDAPSGTAIQLAKDLIEMDTNSLTKWDLDKKDNQETIPIFAIRETEVPGTHTIKYKSIIDEIQITHQAFNRKGFAYGAIKAAEFLVGKKGFYTMDDLLNLNQDKN